eukprot:Sro454_g146370.2  (238) ;mRNA; r:38427-39140
MSWLNEIPPDWKLTVWETCGQSVASPGSKPFKNAGSEECSGYLQTIVEDYDNLPDINFFLQSDALIGRGKPTKVWRHEHTPFKTFMELRVAAESYRWDSARSTFLHFGPKQLDIPNINDKEFTLAYHPRDIFDIMGLHYSKDATTAGNTTTQTRTGACFAVTREQIRWKPKEHYKKLQDSILLGESSQARYRCWALENTWHAVLGQPYMLPSTSTVDHLWDARLNLYHGQYGNQQQQ